MTLRKLELPTDLRPIAEFVSLAFRYPENKAWSTQPDEAESLVDMLNSLARLWPLIWPVRSISPALRDAFCGHVWEEDGQLAGTVIFQRRGKTDTWLISSVAVLPGYRRRGIGRELVRSALNSIRERGGKAALLDVIVGNAPAYALYERLGFERFTGSVVFGYDQDQLLPELVLPHGYAISPLGLFDWRADYMLAQRIVPAGVRKYEPFGEAHFRHAWSMRLLMPIVWKIGGVRKAKIAAHTASNDRIVALAEHTTRLRPGGLNRVDMRVDPAHAELARYLVQNLIYTVQRLSPGRRIEIAVPQWQDVVIKAVGAAGCVRRFEHHRMGIILQPPSCT